MLLTVVTMQSCLTRQLLRSKPTKNYLKIFRGRYEGKIKKEQIWRVIKTKQRDKDRAQVGINEFIIRNRLETGRRLDNINTTNERKDWQSVWKHQKRCLNENLYNEDFRCWP